MTVHELTLSDAGHCRDHARVRGEGEHEGPCGDESEGGGAPGADRNQIQETTLETTVSEQFATQKRWRASGMQRCVSDFDS